MRRAGIDIGLQAAHKAALFDDGTLLGKPFAVERTKEGIDALVQRATAGHDGPVEFVMEPTGLGWVALAAELSRRGHRTYLPKPQKTSALRKFLSQHAKTDGVDAQACGLVRHVDQDGVHELRVPSAGRMTLRLAVKQRSRLVVEAARSKGRIQSWLVLGNPHLGKALGRDATTEVATALLRRHLDPFAIVAAGKAELRRFWQRHSHGRMSERQLEAVWQACERTCALYETLRNEGKLPFEYAALQQLIRIELERVEFLETQIEQLDALIRDRYRALDPARTLEEQVPGVGETIAATIEAFAGDVERFTNAKRFAAYFGLVPRTKQTGIAGEKPRQRLTQGGPNLLKQYLFLAAETARRNDPELAALYDGAIARGKHHYSAVVIVAHRLVRRIYALLKAREQGAAVAYRLRSPEGAALGSAAEARAIVRERFPSKAAKALAAKTRKRAAEASPQITGSVPQSQTGSSEDATNVVVGAPPAPSVAEPGTCGKVGGKDVANNLISQANLSLDVT